MSIFWWKIIALQILIATLTCTTGLELNKNTKLSNEMNNPRIEEQNIIDKTEILKDNNEEYDENRLHQHTHIKLLGPKKDPIQYLIVCENDPKTKDILKYNN